MLKERVFAAALAVFALVFPGSPSLSAQTTAASPPEGSNWQHVMALPIGTYVHVNARTRHMPCTLTAVDAETLKCTRDTGVGTKDVTFQRAEITKVQIARRGRSALAGAGIGAGTGALVGGIASINNNYFAVRGALAMIGGFAGLFSGAPTGYLTDFTASTVYRAK